MPEYGRTNSVWHGCGGCWQEAEMADDLAQFRRVTRVIAACEACGHQAIVGLPVGGRLRCSKCGEWDPEIEPCGQLPPPRPMLMGFS